MNNQQAMALLVESEQIISKEDFRNLFDSQKNHVDVPRFYGVMFLWGSSTYK